MGASMTDPVTAYAERVAAGDVPGGRYHILACKRHLSDLKKQDTPAFPYVFSWSSADRFLRFARKFHHYKGEGEAGMKWAGKPFEPSENQIFRLGSIFGWRRVSDGLRRFTTSYQEMPRKSGKTFENGIIGLYATFFEGEPGAEGVCGATKRQQARRVFDDMVKFIKSSGLKTRLRVQAGSIHSDATASKFEPLGKDADSVDGLNLHVIITDEYHAHKTNDLVDVLESSTGARRNPLHSIITTAGDDPVSPCGKMHDYICKILEGVIDDEATQAIFGFIASADPGDDWQLESTWRKANPQWGISVLPTDLRKRALEAKNVPSKAAEFRQKRLNEWVNASTPWLSIDGWRKGQSLWSADELLHQSCWVGVDLASQIDLCAMVFVFPPQGDRKTWRLLRWVWTPKETLHDRAHRDRAPYEVWADQGHLLTVDGVRINHQIIRDVLKAQRQRYRIEQIGFDPWHADQVVDALIHEDGFNEQQVVMVPQTYAGMSKAALDFEAAVLEGIVDANSCPLMAWCASNVVVQRDGKDNCYPVKKRSRGRIDPIMATIIGWRLAELGVETQRKGPRRAAKVWTPQGWKSPLPPEPAHA